MKIKSEQALTNEKDIRFQKKLNLKKAKLEGKSAGNWSVGVKPNRAKVN